MERDFSSSSKTRPVRVFQSTRPRGARLAYYSASGSRSLFQSTRPRGARPQRTYQTIRPSCFNPRARVGRDRCWRFRSRSPHRFNPRARVGRDFSGRSWSRSWACFNPRARVGRDGVEAHAVVIPVAVSIHVPAWGATVFDTPYWPSCKFQSTRPHGARSLLYLGSKTCALFQSTRPRGARRSA